MSEHNWNKDDLPKTVQDRIERNRQKAIIKRKSKLVSHPYAVGAVEAVNQSIITVGSTRYKDTGGGFLLEEHPQQDLVVTVVQDLPPVLDHDKPTCEKCNQQFAVSWLFDNFSYKCCDSCKDSEEHKLITKTEALNIYLLKDFDLDKRDPPLKYITRKNPHNVRWGDMKLYLRQQVEQRSLEVWGSEDNISEERMRREEQKLNTKVKKYQKQLKQLRMIARSSLFDKTSAAAHVHEFGEESYNEEEDNYSRSCLTCTYVETFEKM